MHETHLSKVFLVGDFAYKFKKPLNLGPPFQSQESLKDRKDLCMTELTKNKAFNSVTYVGVVKLVKGEGGYRVAPMEDERDAVDFAVKMKRFESGDRLDQVLRRVEQSKWRKETESGRGKEAESKRTEAKPEGTAMGTRRKNDAEKEFKKAEDEPADREKLGRNVDEGETKRVEVEESPDKYKQSDMESEVKTIGHGKMTRIIAKFAEDLVEIQSKCAKSGRTAVQESLLMRKIVLGNGVQLAETKLARANTDVVARVKQLNHWLNKRFEELSKRKYWDMRIRDGMVRYLHGDLHTENLFLDKDGAIRAFDCVEFNDDLSCTDVSNDISFLFMDLAQRGRDELAWVFLNAWCDRSGDYAVLESLSFFVVHRAAVRAKVAALKFQDKCSATDKACADECESKFESFLGVALSYCHEPSVCVFATAGLSGSGKSHLSEKLVSQYGCVRARSDVERKRMFAEVDSLDSSDPNKRLNSEAYQLSASDATYNRLENITKSAVCGGIPLSLDAAFLSRSRRHHLIDFVESLGLHAQIVFLHCKTKDINVLRARVSARTATGKDASDADISVLNGQVLDEFDPSNETVIEFQSDDDQFDSRLVDLVSKMKSI